MSRYLKKQNQHRAFSLVEIVIAAAIMLILAAVIFSALINYKTRQTLNSYTTDVRTSVNKARGNTLASLDDTTYGVHVGTSSVAYFTGSDYNSGETLETYDFPGRVTATSSFSGGTWWFVFDRLTGEPTATGTITITDARTNASTTITIHNTGLIE